MMKNIFLYLFVIAFIALELYSCSGGEDDNSLTEEVVESILLTSDLEVIDLDEKEFFQFKVVTNLGEDVTSASTFYINGEAIAEKGSFYPERLGFYKVEAKYKGVKSNIVNVEVKGTVLNEIFITSDSKSVSIDSEKYFTFTVKTDLDLDVTSSSIFYVNGEKITGNTYKPTVEGNYEVYAIYENYISETFIVTVQNNSMRSITLSAANTSIKMGTDQEFVFTIQSDENKDITTMCTFYVNGVKIIGNTYKPTEPGSYEVYALYEGLTSNTITVTSELATFVKNALIEDFTGTWCGWCPRVSYAIEQVKLNSNKVISVAIHGTQSSSPSGSFYDPLTYDKSAYPYAPSSYPTGVLDRGKYWSSPQPSYLNEVLEFTGDQNNLGLAILDTSLSGNRVSFKVKVGIGEAKDAYNNQFKDFGKFGLVVYLVEDDLIYDQVNYTSYYGGGEVISNFKHHDVLRSSLTSMVGDDIPVSYRTKGSVYTRSFDIQVPSNVKDYTKLEIVAFVVGSPTGQANMAINVQSVKLGESQDFEVSN
ncbi:MAG: Omp28-related outer membrane protein [Flavobacteriales bacterium]